MTIDNYIKENDKPYRINGINCTLFNVNYGEKEDINTPFHFDDGKEYSFKERLDKAIEELTDDIQNKNEKEVKQYYKENTEDGNQNYYGCWIFVSTDEIETDDGIYFGVRMD